MERASLVVLWRPADGGRRAGFAVSRQIRGAVRRNRARRRLREAFRATRDATPGGVVLMIVAKRAALDTPYPTLLGDLRGALEAVPGGRPA